VGEQLSEIGKHSIGVTSAAKVTQRLVSLWAFPFLKGYNNDGLDNKNQEICLISGPLTRGRKV
jgi:hypothetical protein